jgi:tetratricopeptide (TPR) repeat protein
LGTCLERSEQYEEATAVFEQAIQLYQLDDEPELLAKAQLGLSRALWRTGRKDKAEELVQKSLLYLDERGQIRELAFIQQDLGEFFASVGDKELAYAYLAQSQQVLGRIGIEPEAQKVGRMLEGMTS